MKFSVFLLSFLATSRVTLAAPAASVDLAELPLDMGLEVRSPNLADAPLAILEQRDYRVCEIINRTIRTIGTSKFTLVYITMGTGLARSVCEYVDGGRCADLSYIIQAGLTLVYVAAAHYSEPSLKAYRPNVKSMFPRTISGCEPALVHRLQVTGFTLDNSPKHDIIADHYDNGDTVLQLPLPGGNLAANGTAGSSSNLHKRFNKPGFKISFTTRERSKLTEAHQKFMALAGAAAWAVYADNASHKMNELIGFAETEHAANFYYRIIPEIKGFGTNYETVDVCGGMASYL